MIFTSPDGARYVGEYKDGKRNGQGKFTSPDGFMYEGEWRNGVTWNGIYYDKYGWKYFGSWKNGELWNGTEYDKNGNIIKNILYGRNLKIR